MKQICENCGGEAIIWTGPNCGAACGQCGDCFDAEECSECADEPEHVPARGCDECKSERCECDVICDDRRSHMNNGLTCLQAIKNQPCNWCDRCKRRQQS